MSPTTPGHPPPDPPALIPRGRQQSHALYHTRSYNTPTPLFAGKPFTDFESTTVVPELVTAAHGIVLDLGPGSGNQIERFDASKIEHVYGVEPNTAFTDFFMQRLAGTKVGMDGKYTLVHCGIEDSDVLDKYGLVEGSVDCVVSMQVMVSLDFRRLDTGRRLVIVLTCTAVLSPEAG